MWDAKNGGEGSGSALDRLLASLKLFPYLAGSAPGEMVMGKGMITDSVTGGHLGGQARLAPDVMAGHEESSPYPLAIQNLHKLVCVGVAWPIVEGQVYDALRGAGMPKDGAVEPGPGREPLVHD